MREWRSNKTRRQFCNAQGETQMAQGCCPNTLPTIGIRSPKVPKAVIAYCLRHTEAVAAYLGDPERDAADVRRIVEARQHPDPLRARLLASHPTS